MSSIRRSSCPLSLSLELFGDKWTLLILRDISFFDKSCFKDLAKEEGIASNILANRLEKLVDAGLLNHAINPANKSSKVYTLTESGLSLVPLLLDILSWGRKHFDMSTSTLPNLLTSFDLNRDKVCTDLMESLRAKHNI